MATPDENVYPHATGAAASTVSAHQGPQELVLYGSWFCPFVQRVWIALEEKDAPYQYVEVNPYKKPEIIKVNPRGLVPAITHHGENLYESTILVEYVEDAFTTSADSHLLPKDAIRRAKCRLWVDHCNSRIIPSFYRYLQAQEKENQEKGKNELLGHLATFRDAMNPEGQFFMGSDLTIVDIALIPFALRFDSVFKHYRQFEVPKTEQWTRFHTWLEAVKNRPSVSKTCSNEDKLLQVYERYANNTAQSEVAMATREGKHLP